jgi:hypothetical protein
MKLGGKKQGREWLFVRCVAADNRLTGTNPGWDEQTLVLEGDSTSILGSPTQEGGSLVHSWLVTRAEACAHRD